MTSTAIATTQHAPPARYDVRLHGSMPLTVMLDGVMQLLVFAYDIAEGWVAMLQREGMHIVYDDSDVALEEERHGTVTVEWALPYEHADVQAAVRVARELGIL